MTGEEVVMLVLLPLGIGFLVGFLLTLNVGRR